MKIIKLTTITDAMLIDSDVPETDHAAWSAVTTYGIGDYCIVTSAGVHKVFVGLRSANTNHDPVTDTSDPPYWKEIGPTNRWAMFDQVNSTATEQASAITVTIAPGIATGIAFFGLVGTTLQVKMFDGDGGPEVYDSEPISLDGSHVESWFDYFFAPFEQRSEVVLTNLPPYGNGHIEVTLTGGGNVAMGTLAVGLVDELADVRMGPRATINDFSIKETDEDLGITSFVKKPYSKENNYTLWVPKSRVRRVWDQLVSLRATPCVYIGSEDADYSMLVVYGWYRDFSIVVQTAKHCICDLELNGLT